MSVLARAGKAQLEVARRFGLARRAAVGVDEMTTSGHLAGFRSKRQLNEWGRGVRLRPFCIKIGCFCKQRVAGCICGVRPLGHGYCCALHFTLMECYQHFYLMGDTWHLVCSISFPSLRPR